MPSHANQEQTQLIATIGALPGPRSIADMQGILLDTYETVATGKSRQDIVFNALGGPNRRNSELIWDWR